MNEMAIDIPSTWRTLQFERMRGPVLILGGSDVGKTTFARYLFERLSELGPTAYIDGDPGQSLLGPPTTLSLAMWPENGQGFPPPVIARKFVGAVSPRGHMLPMVVSARRLVDIAQRRGARTIVYDTDGLVDPLQGGFALKLALIDLLELGTIVAIQRERELEGLLVPLRLSRRASIVDLRPSAAVSRRDFPLRRATRAMRFAEYFAQSTTLDIPWTRYGVLPEPRFVPGRLAGLENRDGLLIGLGIVLKEERTTHTLTLYTPVTSIDALSVIHLGDLLLNPETFEDHPLY